MYKALWWAEIVTKGLTVVWQQPKYLKQLSRAEQYLYCKCLCPSSGLMRLGRMATRCSWLSRMEPMYKDGFHILRAQEVPLFRKPLSPKRLIPCMGLKTRSKDSQAVLNVEREYLLGMIDKKMSWHPRSTVQLPPLPPRPCHPYLPPPPGEYEEAGGRSWTVPLGY